MKILWANPSFLDYRIPLYAELNKLCDNSFHLVFSKKLTVERCVKKVETVLGGNAHGLAKEKFITIGRNTGFANSYIELLITRGLYKTIARVKPNVIIAEGFFKFTPLALLYAFFHRIPILIAYERTAFTERNCPSWRRFYRRVVGLFVNGYIANGKLTKEYLMSQGVRQKNIFTEGMCADSEGLASQVASVTTNQKMEILKHLCGTVPLGLIYVFVGQMIPRKGVKELLQSWANHAKRYKEDRLLLVGDGELLDVLSQEYKDNKSIVFTGAIDYSQIYRFYAVSDVFIIPTLEDNWSLVVPEAMACGLPVACSIYNGCYPELVRKDENGITFDPLDGESVLNTLDYFHHVDLQRFGQQSKIIEKKFSPENTAIKIFRAINNYLK